MKKVYLVAYTVAVLMAGMMLGFFTENSIASKYCGRCSEGDIHTDTRIDDASTISVKVYKPYKIVSTSNNSSLATIKISK